ncbi:nodulation protein NfeD [Chelativorans sp. ZYF759]|uniref:NfeD family protein n=1 Tax=Chelativorans sp. ZYF759 TaxID=2692213 RepID=UPI00145E1A4E|nr:nodulation protein NfeD [Chelativorans sp. ZYF759]NMG39414.1 nodulation protein NfeD [Chelativorans sp. ZYF759]
MSVLRVSRILVLAMLALLGAWGIVASGSERTAVVLKFEGAVTPASADYIIRGINGAAERDAGIVIIEMDTPGGLDSSMRQIIRAIIDSPIPVATYVAPSGARAASAGTYILYASHVAAMAPSTHLGAATPVAIGGGGMPFGGRDDEGEDDSGGTARPPASAQEAKAINDAVAYIRGLAEMRGRNADWAERAVREAATLTSSAASRENVIDFTATSVEDLLEKSHGMTIQLGQAETVLETRGLTIEVVEPDWRTQLLAIITNPNVALIFMMVGVYGLIFEFMNPGTLVPGTIGGISLILGLYSLAVLPVSYAGVGLLILGLILMVAEAFAPSFGILGIGGAIAFVLGAAILFDTDVPGIEISWAVIGGVAASSLILTLIIARLALRSTRSKVVSGREELIGAMAEVLDWKGQKGHVFVHGERWQATADQAMIPGQPVRVVALDGLTLKIDTQGAQETPTG